MAKNKRSKFKVPTPDKKPDTVVKNPLVAKSTRDSVWFDLRSKTWLTSVSEKGFTNFLSGPDDFRKNHFEVFYTIIPKIIEEWESIVGRTGRRPYEHCHLLKDEKKEEAQAIFKRIYKYELDKELRIWQFGFIGSVRLICLHNDLEKAFIPIFIDHHHLIYDSLKYNQEDYGKYSYCAVCDYHN